MNPNEVVSFLLSFNLSSMNFNSYLPYRLIHNIPNLCCALSRS